MEKVNILRKIITNITQDIRKQDFLVYFGMISILEITEEKVVFWVISSFVKDNLMAKFYDNIKKATIAEFPNIVDIEISIDINIENPNNENVIKCSTFFKDYWTVKTQQKTISQPMTQSQKMKSYDTEVKKSEEWDDDGLDYAKWATNERYKLTNFIVGPSNQLPYSACEAVVKNPWKSYNPLYIYWDVWLWKTHLLQWTWNAIFKKYKWKKVRYITADKFITDYITAVKKKWVEKLRQKYAEADVLIIDDVQFLQKKEQTQNELYNIFNILYDAEKQIIISWDKPPKDLTELEPRLKSRFEWWIIVDISKPDFETRLAILQEKARDREFLIPKEVAEFIATNATDSVRELEWALNQLIAEYELTWAFPSLEKISKSFKKLSFTSDLLWESKLRTKTTIKSYDDIIKAVSDHFWIEKEWILWENRKKEFMIPRQVAMYLLKTKMNYTYERIWNIFSWRNHAAVLYSCNKLETIIKKDKNLLYEINQLRDWIGI